MTAAIAIVLVLAVALFVVLPLLGEGPAATDEGHGGGSELWAREKAVAVLAITEADFDRATGKLSDDDYQVLRADYEGRALQAMDEMDRLVPAAQGSAPPSDTPGTVRFCPSCGEPFTPDAAFCGSCGHARAAA